MKIRMAKIQNAKELLSKKFGEEGSAEREEFRKSAYAYYFGEILKDRRKELKMTQETLAAKIGKKRPHISRIENGEDMYLSNFALVAKALRMSIELKVE